jgi:eukaryotic-like serine/threonine-protein kinase
MAARYSNNGSSEEAKAAVEKAFELRDRLSGPAGFLGETLYYDVATGESQKSIPIYERWTETFPLDVRARSNFSTTLRVLGQAARSIPQAQEAVRLAPSVSSYFNLIFSMILADQPQAARAAFDEAQSRGIDGVDLHYLRGLIAFLQGDEAARKEQFAWGIGKSEAKNVVGGEADAEAYYGRFRKARALYKSAAETAQKAGLADDIVDFHLEFAAQEVEVGNASNARTLIATSLTGPQNLLQKVRLALVLARLGDVTQAQHMAEEIDKAFPTDTLIQNYCLPAIYAAVDLQKNEPGAAIEVLRAAQPYDLAYPNQFNSLTPAYLRGIAYQKLGNGHLAAAEFQKVIDHPGVVGRSVLGSVARLQLARSLTASGENAGARKAYEEFLDLWKDADQEIPVYREAKSEYAKLQ